ncbi:MAG: hypothetical protein AAB937_00315 [Patescibacteria group bacterium]
MQKLTNWCKNKWLLLSTCFLLVFIPLYPKLPLLDVVQTWVYIRLEDFLVAIVLSAVGLLAWKRKIDLNTPLTIPIIIYWMVGLLSLFVAMIFVRNPDFIPHLAFLHLFRRVEYMGMFFVGYYAVRRNPKALSMFLWSLTIATTIVIIYGIGQKFSGWPAFLTMNEEFAKGVPLRLPPTARIASTFGGHYDLAAYLVLLIPLFGSFVFSLKKIWQKLVMLLVATGSLILLLFTASRVSFGVYLVSIVTMLWWKNKKIWIIPVVVVSMLLLNSVSTASDRFYKTIRFSDVIIDLSTGQPIGTLESINGANAVVSTQEKPDVESLPTGSGFISAPAVASKPTKTFKTIEMFVSTPLSTGSGEIATVSGNFLIQKAFVYDISFTTRLQGQWPKAMNAFKRNMFLGSGYSSLSVAADSDYMRMLGETGVIGAIAFLGIFVTLFFLYRKQRPFLSPHEDAFVTGLSAGIVGLFLNATLIDVFEASKVAFTLWPLIGAMVAVLSVRPWRESYPKLLISVFTSQFAIIVYIVCAVFLTFRESINLYFVGDDFTWLKWAASTTMSDLPKFFVDASGFFYRPIAKIVYFVLYSLFWLKPWGYHMVLIGFFAIIAIFVYLLQRGMRIRKSIAFTTTMLFVVLSVHHENVVWISGLSSVLSTMFLVISLWACMKLVKDRKAIGLQIISVSFLSLLSALSYEGGIVAPVIVSFCAVFILRKGKQYALILLVIPLYWWMRSNANSLLASGDYSINFLKLPFNLFANSIGYLMAVFVGPRMVEWMTSLREILKSKPQGVLAAMVGISALVFWILKHTHKALVIHKEALMWKLLAVIALLPFLGLGGMAERYALSATVFMTIVAGMLFERYLKNSRIFFIGLVVFVMVFILNYTDLQRVIGDWKKAATISERTMLTLKANYFPLQSTHTFVFVNMPTRYGRAWIFSVGLEDALWHMFKFNPYAYLVFTAPTVKDGFAVKSPLGAPDVLLFDELYALNKARQEIKIIEVE